MVIRKLYFAALFILVFLSLGVFAAEGRGGIEISSAGLIINITSPANGSLHNSDSPVSDFDWAVLYQSSALVSCKYLLNGNLNSFNCSLSSVAISTSEGWNNLNLFVNSSDASANEPIAFFVDTIPPLFSNPTENPSPATYAPGQIYEFSIDLDGTETSVWYEFEGQNYTDNYNSGATYSFNRSDLAAGNYSYRWFASDSLGNINQTEVYTYIIGRADPTSGMSINGTGTIIYGTYSDFDGVETNVNDDGCNYLLSPNNENLFGAGTVTFTYSTAGCQNYSAGSVTKDLTINKALGSVSLLLNGNAADLSFGYENAANASASTPHGSIILLRDGFDVTAENSNPVVLGVEYYNYTAFSSGDQNYTEASATYFMNISKAIPGLSLEFRPSDSVSEGIETNVSGIGCPWQLSCALYRNGSEVNNSDIALLPIGTYSYMFNTTGNENYSAAEISSNLTVSSIPSGTGGGGGGGVCYSTWTCTEWSECDVYGIETRTCILSREYCYPALPKPAEVQNCSYIAPSGQSNRTSEPQQIATGGNREEEEVKTAPITGAVINAAAGKSIAVVILILSSIAIAYGIVAWRRKQFQIKLKEALAEAEKSQQ